MLSFESDYIAGAHPAILQRFIETNLISEPGYGSDEYTLSAIDKIKNAIAESSKDVNKDNLQVYLLTGGTQTNQIVIDTMLAPYEGVVAATTGHVNTHEAGAIEHTGHKVLAIEGKDGKLSPESVEDYLRTFAEDDNKEHMVFPGMVYITYPTEYGTLYTKDELSKIYSTCKKYDVPLYIDGARLGYGLASESCDITLGELATLCDSFYIGGTKVGALCGEAVVYTHNNMPKHFLTQVKQHGALVAKGRLLGIQFDTLFTDDLYMKISKHAISMSAKLKDMLLSKGYKLHLDSPTNQQFVVLTNDELDALSKKVRYSYWERLDDNHSVVRLATSWSTTEDELAELNKVL